MPELVDLEVTEVSLVDRPATGRRFRVFKREGSAGEADERAESPLGALRRLLKALFGPMGDEAADEVEARLASGPEGEAEGEAPIDGRGAEAEDQAPVDGRGAEALSKALDRLEGVERSLEAVTQRVARLEAAPPRRRSELVEPEERESLWKGVF